MSGSSSDGKIITADEVKALLNAATPGPWTAAEFDDAYIVAATTWVAEAVGATEADFALLSAAPNLAHTVVKMSEERDWLAQALQDQEAAYAALEQQYLALTDAHAALVDDAGRLFDPSKPCQEGNVCEECKAGHA